MKLGIIGLNEGNGHPFSYSAIFNGYDPDALQRDCPYDAIKQYLPLEHQNKNSISGAKITHVWTQDPELSRKVANVAMIPNIANHYEDMIGKVDGVILARDDAENHFEMARPFLEKGIPLFIDKQLTHTGSDLEKLLKLCDGDNYPLMACSSVRYNPNMPEWKASVAHQKALSIQGISRGSWLRYAHHLFEAVAVLFGLDIEYVKYLGFGQEHEMCLIKYETGLTAVLEFQKDVSLPIRINIHFQNRPHLEVQVAEAFRSFKATLEHFVNVVETRRPIIPLSEITRIACVVLAGAISKERGGAAVRVSDVWEGYAGSLGMVWRPN
jgi:hypothetical protein